MTPKSLLRHEQCVSQAEDFTGGSFKEILNGPLLDKAEKVKRLVFCSGKIYYDLLKFREENKITTAAFIRVEQLYPLHEEQIKAAVAQYPNAKTMVWCQEESQNMGAWNYIGWQLRRLLNTSIWYAGRNASASTAVGAKAVHDREQSLVLQDAFSLG
jgi:2-oxoglutarate dehydrogenase E1 component